MTSRVVVVLAVLSLLVAGSARPVHGDEPGYASLSGGWSFPVGGPIADAYKSGPTILGVYLVPMEDDPLLHGLQIGYSWFPLDTSQLEANNPGSSFSGNDLGLLSITFENDALLGTSGSTGRPFVNSGVGYYQSFFDEPTITTGGTSQSYSTGVHHGSFFGFHIGIGAVFKRDRFAIRIDANYQYLFQAGKNLEFFPLTAGIVFYPSG